MSDSFDEFLRQVAPLMELTPLYRSLEFACVAARQGSEWVLISGRILLNTELCSSDAQIATLVRLNELLALSGRIRPETVNNLVENFRNSWVLRGLEDVRLTAEGVGPFSWTMPPVYSIDKRSNPDSRWNRVLSMTGRGADLSGLLSYSAMQVIESQLRPACLATAQTRGLVLEYRGAALVAYYSANCGGRTRSLEGGEGYPYFAVECSFCQRNSRERRGHGLGLCQEGAAGMAAAGAEFREILSHYYPNTILGSLPKEP